MYPEKESKRFHTLYPDAWETILKNKKGTLITKHGLFTYATVKPLANGWKSTSGNYQAYMPKSSETDRANYSWKIVSFIPAEDLMAASKRQQKPLILLGIVILLIWAMYSFISASAKIQRKQTRKALQEKDQRIREIVDSAFDGIITIDEKGIIGSFNPAATEIFGYQAHEMIGKNINILTPSPHKEMHDSYIQHYIDSDEAHIIDKPREVEAIRKDGSSFPLSLCVGAKDYGDHWMFTGIVRDITERKEMEAELEKMAVTDGLTGLHNRGYFNHKLESEFLRAKRYNTPLSLIILDIDHFIRCCLCPGNQCRLDRPLFKGRRPRSVSSQRERQKSCCSRLRLERSSFSMIKVCQV